MVRNSLFTTPIQNPVSIVVGRAKDPWQALQRRVYLTREKASRLRLDSVHTQAACLLWAYDEINRLRRLVGEPVGEVPTTAELDQLPDHPHHAIRVNSSS